MCLLLEEQHASGAKTKTVYVTQTESDGRFFLEKRNDTIWLAKGIYAPLNNNTG